MAKKLCNTEQNIVPVPKTTEVKSFSINNPTRQDNLTIYYNTGLIGWSGAAITSINVYMNGTSDNNPVTVSCSYNSSNGRVTFKSTSDKLHWISGYMQYIWISFIVYKL